LFQGYCRHADNSLDQVVFQHGFAVNALTADYTANDNFVTLACRAGGPPTVRLWGYTYQTTVTDRFQASLHMKRASYCGDNRFFTKTGTVIKIYDSVGKQNDIATANYAQIEAVWTPTGAKCVNYGTLSSPSRLRHIGTDAAVGWPDASDPEFDGWCGSVRLPRCTAADLVGALVVSQAAPYATP
jgi:hypothetical protein